MFFELQKRSKDSTYIAFLTVRSLTIYTITKETIKKKRKEIQGVLMRDKALDPQALSEWGPHKNINSSSYWRRG
jgi:hypothetical protein